MLPHAGYQAVGRHDRAETYCFHMAGRAKQEEVSWHSYVVTLWLTTKPLGLGRR